MANWAPYKNRRMCEGGKTRRQRTGTGNPNQIEIYESTDVCLGQPEFFSTQTHSIPAVVCHIHIHY